MASEAFLTWLEEENKKEDNYTVLIEQEMKNYTSFRIGGKASLLVMPHHITALCQAIARAESACVPYTILGFGSNVLFDDEGFSGVVFLTKLCKNSVIFGNTLTAECGAGLSDIIRKVSDACLGGLTPLYGIPGTIGGAVMMNAGAYGVELADYLASVTVYHIKTQTLQELTKEECAFSYRDSLFRQGEYLVCTATFVLPSYPKDTALYDIQETIKKRAEKQPLNLPSAGSTFKRPLGDYASRLIDKAGLKGLRVGGAMVSPKHAGFIVNAGNATAKDVLALIKSVKKSVKEQANILLEEEIITIKNP